MSIDLSIIFPCYQASDFVQHSLDQVAEGFFRHMKSFEIIAVDDGSPDGTGQTLDVLAATRPWLVVVKHSRNRGKGQALLTGFQNARGDNIIVNDIDLQYPVSDMLHCYRELKDNDDSLIIGSRLHSHSIYHIRPRQLRYIYTRQILSRFLNFVLRAFFLPGIFDTQCGLKGFPREFIEVINSGLSVVRGFAFDIELLLIARIRNFSIREMPVNFNYTDIPSTVKFISAGTRIIKDLVRIGFRWIYGRYK